MQYIKILPKAIWPYQVQHPFNHPLIDAEVKGTGLSKLPYMYFTVEGDVETYLAANADISPVKMTAEEVAKELGLENATIDKEGKIILPEVEDEFEVKVKSSKERNI